MSSVQKLNSAYGIDSPLQEIPQKPIVAKRNPNARDKMQRGTLWVNTITNASFILTSITNNVANWQVITLPYVSTVGPTQAMTTNTGYIISPLANALDYQVSFTLPATSTVGDVLEISTSDFDGSSYPANGGTWSIGQGAGQFICFQSGASTPGITGSFFTNTRIASVRLICSVANTTWIVQSVSGDYVEVA